MVWQKLPFLDMFDDVTGGNIKTKSGDYLPMGTVPIVDQGKELISGYSNDEQVICKTPLPIIIFGDHTRIIKYVDFPFGLGADGVKVLKPRFEADTKYLYYFLQSLYIPNTGYNRHYKYLKESFVLLPPLAEQKRIARILDVAAAVQAQRRATLTHLDTLLQSTFLHMFGDPVTNPMRWPVKPVIESCDCIVPGRDKPKSFTGNIAWITTEDLVPLGITLRSKKELGLTLSEIREVRARIIPKNSVVMTCVGDLGITSVAGQDFVMNQQLHSFQCSDKLNSHFLAFSLSFQKPYMYKMATSTVVPYMNKSVCNSVPTIMPPIELQERFAERVEKIEQYKSFLVRDLDCIESLFQSLQQRAFRGELSPSP